MFARTPIVAVVAVAAAVVCGIAVAAIEACAPSTGGGNPLCTCAADEMYEDTTKECVAPADFVAPDCTDDGQAVCGCDDKGYTSECAAYTAGVEVQYAGACSASHTNGGGGDFGGFGW